MKKLTIWGFLILIFCQVSTAQPNLYFRFDVGPTGDIYHYTDDGKELGTRPVANGLWGIAVGEEISQIVGLETGMYRNYYMNSFYFKNLKLNSPYSELFNTFQVPFRLRTRFNLYKDIFTLETITGFNICINPVNTRTGEGKDKLVNGKGNDSVVYHYSFVGSNNKVFYLIETGLSFSIRLFKGFHLNVNGTYCNGFTKLYQTDLYYRVNNDPIQHGILFTNGDYFNVSFGLKYLLPGIRRIKK